MSAQIAIPHGQIAELCQQYHIMRLSLFGSVLRDDFSPDSDVDVLVEFEPGAGITSFDLVDIQESLRQLLGHPVDIGTPRPLSEHLRDRVLASAQVIYERDQR